MNREGRARKWKLARARDEISSAVIHLGCALSESEIDLGAKPEEYRGIRLPLKWLNDLDVWSELDPRGDTGVVVQLHALLVLQRAEGAGAALQNVTDPQEEIPDAERIRGASGDWTCSADTSGGGPADRVRVVIRDAELAENAPHLLRIIGGDPQSLIEEIPDSPRPACWRAGKDQPGDRVEIRGERNVGIPAAAVRCFQSVVAGSPEELRGQGRGREEHGPVAEELVERVGR